VDQVLPPRAQEWFTLMCGISKVWSMAELKHKKEAFRKWKGYILCDRNIVTLARSVGTELAGLKLNCHLN